MTETFTDFMIRMMAGEGSIKKAVLIFHADDGVCCQQWSPDEAPSKADMLGLLRFAQLGVENDLVESWNSQD